MSVARRTALFSLGAALALVAVKLIVGFATGSLGILAEAVHSGVDAGAALLTVWAVGVADRPADPEHPYGHGKAQNLSALGEAAILVLAAAWIALSAILRLNGGGGRGARHVVCGRAARARAGDRRGPRDGLGARRPQRVERSARSECGALRRRLRRHARRDGGSRPDGPGPPARRCRSRPSSSPCSSSSAPRGWRRSNVNALMDSAPAGAEANLRTVVETVPGVTEVRSVRVRSSGGKYFADVVIGVDRLAGLERSHAVMDDVERVVEHELGGPAEVSVHAEPLAADEQPSERALAAALRVPGVIEVHNATVLMRPGGRAITLHARVDAGLPLREAARITQRLRDEIRRETGANDVYIHLEPHAPGVAAAFDVTGRRADICERVAGAVRPVAGEPEEVLVFDQAAASSWCCACARWRDSRWPTRMRSRGASRRPCARALDELEEVVVEVDP